MAKVPEGFALAAHTDMCPTAAIADPARGFYGVQFHPEVNHTEHGTQMIRNFLYQVCHAKGDWTMEDYCRTAIGKRWGTAKCCWPSPAGWTPLWLPPFWQKP